MSTQPFQDIEKHNFFIPHLFWLSFHMVQKLPYVFFSTTTTEESTNFEHFKVSVKEIACNSSLKLQIPEDSYCKWALQNLRVIIKIGQHNWSVLVI